ncbi:HEAT repeat domain-containing protein [Luteolibacter luteus]|uniref:HEAT repeat domain-containing protein n=1 Tax=Luteolibacter luteus TaxID=2728835 RepID=A0A858RHY5_9BACT|nr:HEAT repeat domain-containing protein [Luteolibacter luteus]QJE96191.1 HEAT repeat domain-containing protein [Luteolibacter luteus]
MNRRANFLTGCSLAILAAALVWVPPRESVVKPADSRAKSLIRAAPGADRVRADPNSSGGLPAPQLSPHAPDSNEHDLWIAQRCQAIESMAWENDDASLKNILAELRNPEAEIREAALGAVVTFGSKAAIPHLEDLARTTEDPAEKLSLLKTAENLKIPSATEYFAKAKKKNDLPQGN